MGRLICPKCDNDRVFFREISILAKLKVNNKGEDLKMIRFKDIKDSCIAIEFKNSLELSKLVGYLNKHNYDYGTGEYNNDVREIDYLGIEYFGDNKFLSLDRSKQHHPKDFVSCGKGYKDVHYKFSEIDWEE